MDDVSACCDAQLGIECLNQLQIAVVHPVEYYGIDVLDDDMFFYHEQFLRVLLPFLVQNYAFYFDYATFFLNFVRDL